MQIGEWLPYVTAISIVGSGLFAFVRWVDQRKRELAEQRFEQYWKLIEYGHETIYLSKQKAAILLLKRYPEYRAETIELLEDAKQRGGPWASQNSSQIEDVLTYLRAKR